MLIVEPRRELRVSVTWAVIMQNTCTQYALIFRTLHLLDSLGEVSCVSILPSLELASSIAHCVGDSRVPYCPEEVKNRSCSFAPS